LAQGVAALEDVDAVLVALADMPMVPPAHFAALVAAFDGNRIASQCAGQVLPPAIFGAGHFAALRALSGIAARGPCCAARPRWRSIRPTRSTSTAPKTSPARKPCSTRAPDLHSGQLVRPVDQASG
jgi:hypothetical protein